MTDHPASGLQLRSIIKGSGELELSLAQAQMLVQGYSLWQEHSPKPIAPLLSPIHDQLNLLFGSEAGRKYLQQRRKLDAGLVKSFAHVGISGYANIVAAIKLAKQFHYGADDVIVTVATDSGALYDSERDEYRNRHFGGTFDEVNAGEVFGSCLTSAATDNVVELTDQLRRQIFNLGYYTWVEQQGVSVEDFERRRSQSFWDGIADSLPEWDRLIEQFNAEASGSNEAGTASKARA